MMNIVKSFKFAFILLFLPVFLHGDAGIEVWAGAVVNPPRAAAGRLPVIKAGKNNGIYITEDPMKIEDRKIEMKELPAVLKKLRKKHDTIAYFREGIYTEPRGEYLRHIRGILDKLELAGFKIRTGDNYQEQYGESTNFVVYIGPGKFRLGADKGGRLVYAYAPQGKKKMKVFTKDVSDPAVWKECAKDFAMIFYSSRMAGMEQKNRDNAFTADEMKMSTVHIRVVIDGKHEWRACYNLDEAPENVRSFIEDCKKLGKMHGK